MAAPAARTHAFIVYKQNCPHSASTEILYEEFPSWRNFFRKKEIEDHGRRNWSSSPQNSKRWTGKQPRNIRLSICVLPRTCPDPLGRSPFRKSSGKPGLLNSNGRVSGSLRSGDTNCRNRLNVSRSGSTRRIREQPPNYKH